MTKEESTEISEQMEFPETFERFAKEYGFKDDKEVYTNGSDLIPIFRVKQWLEHQMTAEEYRQRMIQAFHNTNCDELIALCVLPTEKEFEHLEWLLKNHYKKEPCGDAISREAVDELSRALVHTTRDKVDFLCNFWEGLQKLPSVSPQQRSGRCKDCKYFEYDSVAKVDGIPLIVAHEICKRWGDGCKSKEDGYCFLFEPKMQEVQDE